MGWNEGYTIMEATVITLYDEGVLTANLLDKIMEPYKGTDCDSGGSRNLKTLDGLNVEQVICKVMKPEEYEDIIKNPKLPDDYEALKDIYGDRWGANDKASDLFNSIWCKMWKIW